MIFLDIIPNPFKDSLTSSTAFEAHLLIVCPYCKYTDWYSLEKKTTEHVLHAINKFITNTGLKGTPIDIFYIRADADSIFTGQYFINWGVEHHIKVSCAAPHHQEMNSIIECQWQNMQMIH